MKRLISLLVFLVFAGIAVGGCVPSPIPPPPAVTQGTADDAKHVLAQRFKLPADYIAERLFDRQGCCVMGNMCVDAQGTLYWLINPEFRIYQVEPDGTMKLFAQDLPIDPGAVAFLTLIAYRGRARVVSKVGGRGLEPLTSCV